MNTIHKYYMTGRPFSDPQVSLIYKVNTPATACMFDTAFAAKGSVALPLPFVMPRLALTADPRALQRAARVCRVSRMAWVGSMRAMETGMGRQGSRGAMPFTPIPWNVRVEGEGEVEEGG